MSNILCIDVYYTGNDGHVACVAFDDWSAKEPIWEGTTLVHNVEPYVSGQFYKRELPCIKSILQIVPVTYDIILTDSYVWLDNGVPGLGAHLYEELNHKIKIIGVAKTQFRNAHSIQVSRYGCSPLFITAAGISELDAANAIQTMSGPFRIPTLIKRADTLSRKIK